MGKVSIVRIHNGIMEGLKRAIDLIGGVEKYIRRDDTVMIKPNLNDTELVTDIQLTESLIMLLNEYGISKMIIAESTFGSAQLTEVLFHKSGYQGLAKKYGIRLVNLNKSDITEVKVNNPLVADTLKIAHEAFKFDKIINLPVMKVHYAAGVTLSMKNLKGLLVGPEKKRFHDIGLDKAIVDLNNTIKPVLNIIDGITCMERMGPKGGDLVRLNLLVAGNDIAETDFIGSAVMGYTTDEVKHLKLYSQMNKTNFDAIDVTGLSVDEVKFPFKKVDMKGSIPEKFKVHSSNACSACMNAFILSCSVLEQMNKDPIDIYVGSGWEDTGTFTNNEIAFGNCSIKAIKNCKNVKGCPPFPFELKKVLEENS